MCFVLQPFVMESFAIEMDNYFLERPVFIKINPARSDAVKLLPAPCRGVESKAQQRMHDCTIAMSPATNQAYPFFTMS